MLRAAISCLGTMYQQLGRMTGRSYEETVYILLKSLKNAEVSFFFFLNVFQVKPFFVINFSSF